MALTDEISNALNAWAPNMGESFTALAYLGSASAVSWLNNSPWPSELRLLIDADGHAAASEMWRKTLRDGVAPPAPVLLLILEHMRRSPADMRASLGAFKLGFSKSFANIANRAASALYEDAKHSFAGHEIDVAVARFRAALSEFRFSIESQLLTVTTRRMATGKYATAVAMIGRWINVSPEAVSRALAYSKESMALGNLMPETLTYRLELLVLQFDQTGDTQLLQDALELLSENQRIAKGAELAEAETRYRLALLSEAGSRDARHHLKVAKEKLTRFRHKSSVEEARCSVLCTLVAESEEGRLAMPARSIAIPTGLLALMASKPSTEIWETIRRVISALEDLQRGRGSIPAAVLSVRFLRQMVDGPAEFLEQNDLSRYVEITGWLSEKASYNRHVQWEAGAAALSTAKRTGNQDLAHRAQEAFDALTIAYPDDVAGIVLVEPSHEDQSIRGWSIGDVGQKQRWDTYLKDMHACISDAEKGMVKGTPEFKKCVGDGDPQFSAAINAAQETYGATPKWQAAAASERENVFYESAAETRATRKHFGDTPIIVLTHSPYQRRPCSSVGVSK